jgi:hypothetical protein
MKEISLYNSLVDAWETSTPSKNRFIECVSRVKWDCEYYADGEHNFHLGGFTLSTPTLDPFGEHKWMPSVITSDGSILFFG